MTSKEVGEGPGGPCPMLLAFDIIASHPAPKECLSSASHVECLDLSIHPSLPCSWFEKKLGAMPSASHAHQLNFGAQPSPPRPRST